MDAVGLLLLILFLIAAALALYYALLCLPLASLPTHGDSKYPFTSDHRPLLPQDFNGNHEECAPFVPAPPCEEGTLPKASPPNGAPPKGEGELEGGRPLEAVLFLPTPECAAVGAGTGDPVGPGGPGGPGRHVVLPIDEEPAPTHSAKALPAPKVGPKARPAGLEPTPLQKMSVGDDEDGLLVPGSQAQGPPPQAGLYPLVPDPQSPTGLSKSPPKHVQFVVDETQRKAPPTQGGILKGERPPPAFVFSPKHKWEGEGEPGVPSKKAKTENEVGWVAPPLKDTKPEPPSEGEKPPVEAGKTLGVKGTGEGESHPREGDDPPATDEPVLAKVILPSEEGEAAPAPAEGVGAPDWDSASDTSDEMMKVREYSFRHAPLAPGAAAVIANEVASPDGVPLINYSPIAESTPHHPHRKGELPPTPSPEMPAVTEVALGTPIDAHDLGTPPVTPPMVIGNPCATPLGTDVPPFIVIEPHDPMDRRSSTSSSTSTLSSTSSSSASNGSYNMEGAKEEPKVDLGVKVVEAKAGVKNNPEAEPLVNADNQGTPLEAKVGVKVVEVKVGVKANPEAEPLVNADQATPLKN